MKLIIKTIKQVTYNVEIASEKSTILDLKKEIEKAHGFDSSKQKLLFNGVILEDSKTLEEYKIQDESVIIIMISKVKPINVNKSSNTESSQPKAEEKKEEKKDEKKEEKKPDNKKPKTEQKINEQQFTQQLNSLVDMGFDRPQAESAIKAARGQIDLAIEYLYNGIPEGVNNNNFEQLQNEGEGNEDNNEEEVDPLKKVASIAKVLCQHNPGALATLLQSIQRHDPDLMNLIKEKEEEFKNLLEQPITSQDYRTVQSFQQEIGLGLGGGMGQRQGGMPGQRQIRINLTPQDREAINRLKDLGNFSEAEVVQAYIACDKNEEFTANYLFEQKMKDEGLGGQNNNNNNNNNGNGNSQ